MQILNYPQSKIADGQDRARENKITCFNLPAVITCPGRSAGCSICYANKGKFTFSNVRQGNLERLQIARGKNFSSVVFAELVKKQIAIVRFHVGGDFFDPAYVKRWIAVARGLPEVLFFGYTRSWAIPAIKKPLEVLRRLPNVQLFASWDNSMKKPPKNWRVAFVESGNGLPCPEQSGKKRDCIECKYCIDPRYKGNVIFSKH